MTGVLKTLVEIAGVMHESINRWCGVSGKLKLLQGKLAQLSDECKHWEAEINKVGLSDDEELLQLIHAGQLTLQEEMKKLSDRRVRLATRLKARLLRSIRRGQSTLEEGKINLSEKEGDGRTRLATKLKFWVAPAVLETIIQEVDGVYDSIFNYIRRSKEIKEGLLERLLLRSSKISFNPDDRYTPLVKTEERVKGALGCSNGFPIILLYGGSGTGKTSLARNLGLDFQKESEERRENLVFNRVVYMVCGPDATLEAKQRELAQLLDPSYGDVQESSQVYKVLFGLLKEIRLLIIFDDVAKSQSNLLERMVGFGGKGVKWLVTSQSLDLCEHFKFQVNKIGIEKVKMDQARRILKVLIGWKESDCHSDSDSESDSQIKDAMDQIISRTGANLLALTCVASVMPKERCQQKTEWMRLVRDLYEVLKSKPEIHMHDVGYGQSYWGAIKFGFDRLSASQRSLLILMQMCKGLTVPANVIEYLFQQTRPPNCSECFAKARDELKGKQLIIITKVTHPVLGEDETWTLHSLLRDIIKHELFGDLDEKVSIVERLAREHILFGRGSASNLVTSMAFLYFEKSFRREFAEKMCIISDNPQVADLRKSVIEPISKLLGSPEDGEWTPALQLSISEVFLKYAKDGIFEEKSTSNLLNSRKSKLELGMIYALYNSSLSEHHPVVGHQIMTTLLTRLKRQTALVVGISPKFPSISDCALLSRISWAFAKSHCQNHIKSHATHLDSRLLQIIFEELTSGLARVDESHSLNLVSGMPPSIDPIISSNSNVSWHCAIALADLASGGREIKVKMINYPGTLGKLVTAMGTDDCPGLQEQAARVVINLARSRNEMGLQILDCPGMLDALVEGLGKSKSQELQENSAWALANLANLNDEIRSKIVIFEGALRKLALGMTEIHNDDVNKQCARAITALATEAVRPKMKMNYPKISDFLSDAVTDGKIGAHILHCAIFVLTLLDPEKAKKMHLNQEVAWLARGSGMCMSGRYKEALEDLDMFEESLCETLAQSPNANDALRYRCCTKAKLGDLRGALADANCLVDMERTRFTLQERGVVKQMLGDLPGAIEDLSDGLDFGDDYEVLKQRGYAKFLLNDEDGARDDAERALKYKPNRTDGEYGRCWLGYNSVKFLNFDL